MELIKNHDCVIDYHPEKRNFIADMPSRKNKSVIYELPNWDKKELDKLKRMDALLGVGIEGSLFV